MSAEAHPLQEQKVVAVIGANGMLARMVRARAPQHYVLHLFDLPDFDLTNREQLFAVFTALAPDIIINCAAYTNVDGCESNQEMADRVNGLAVGALAEIANIVDAVLVHVSTDYVFDGSKKTPYAEGDPTDPKSVYGRSKLLGEQSVIESGLKQYFIIRTSWLYGPGGSNFVETILRLAAERDELRIVADQVGTPTYTADLADAIFNLLALADHESPITGRDLFGLYHFSNEGCCSWHEFARAIVDEAHLHHLPIAASEIRPIRTEEYPLPATRPANSVFDKTRYKTVTGAEVPHWRQSLKRYFLNRDQ